MEQNANADHIDTAAKVLDPLMSEEVVDKAYLGVVALQLMCHQLASRSGWWIEYDEMPEQYRKYFIGTKLALVHSEVSETLEGNRKGKMDDHLKHRKADEVELADSVIRIFDLGGKLNMDIAGAIIEKLAYNQQRADHKLEHRAGEGGKSF